MRREPMPSVELLRGVYTGQRGALICPGPSLDDVADLDGTLAGYDVRIGVNEAILATPEIDYLTCFDPKAARKTCLRWPLRLAVVVHEGHQADMVQAMAPLHERFYTVAEGVLTEARAASLGRALGFSKLLGVASLDLYGVDLCRPVERHYAASVMAGHPGHESIHEGELVRYAPDGWCVPEHFKSWIAEIERVKGEWSGIKITNKSWRSMLTAFPKG